MGPCQLNFLCLNCCLQSLQSTQGPLFPIVILDNPKSQKGMHNWQQHKTPRLAVWNCVSMILSNFVPWYLYTLYADLHTCPARTAKWILQGRLCWRLLKDESTAKHLVKSTRGCALCKISTYPSLWAAPQQKCKNLLNLCEITELARPPTWTQQTSAVHSSWSACSLVEQLTVSGWPGWFMPRCPSHLSVHCQCSTHLMQTPWCHLLEWNE